MGSYARSLGGVPIMSFSGSARCPKVACFHDDFEILSGLQFEAVQVMQQLADALRNLRRHKTAKFPGNGVAITACSRKCLRDDANTCYRIGDAMQVGCSVKCRYLIHNAFAFFLQCYPAQVYAYFSRHASGIEHTITHGEACYLQPDRMRDVQRHGLRKDCGKAIGKLITGDTPAACCRKKGHQRDDVQNKIDKEESLLHSAAPVIASP